MKTPAVQQAQREKLFDLMTDCKNPVWNRFFSNSEMLQLTDHLLANGVTVREWRDAKADPPEEYRDECMELIPFLVCESGTEYPFRAFYDGKTWGDGWSAIPVTHWMPLPEPPKEE